MMSGPRLVNKQFNSPINLYSPQAIQETLEKQTQVLSNGAVGIDFKQLAKPTNLQNSAVLRMLEEEEERKRAGKAGLKRVAWPPPPEEQDVDYVEQGPVQVKTRGAGEYATYQNQKSPASSIRADSPAAVHQQTQLPPQPRSPQPQLQPQSPLAQPQPNFQPQPQQVQPTFGLRTPSAFQAQNPTPKAWAPVATPAPASPQTVLQPLKTWTEKPQLVQSPTPPISKQPVEHIIPIAVQKEAQSQTPPIVKTWNEKPQQVQPQTPPITKQPVEHIIPIVQKEAQPQTPPISVPIKTWNEKPVQQEVRPPISKQPVEHIIPIQVSSGAWKDQPQGQSPQPYNQPQSTTAPHFEPPPATITLRPEPPISQEPPPVFQAQPAATNPNSGSMRGDLKWPPQSVREQTEAENQARIELAKGPVCRPRRVRKDYSSFFAQHALGNNYPGYRAPPGTQYFTPAYQH